MNGNIKESIKSILGDNSFNKLLFKSIALLKLTRRRKFGLFLLCVLLFIMYMFVFNKHIDAIKSSKEIVGNAQSILISLFSVVITGYAIFQALTNGKTLIAMLKVNREKMSKFQEYNYFFFSISLLYLFIIIFNFITSIFLNNIPDKWSLLFLDKKTNDTLYSVLMSLYIVFILNALIEMKSFVYNLYQLFSTHAVASAIQQIEKEKAP
ncbi:hypothetical protein J41TS12_06200 [Paenibacillus antibioticophila]|uniref:Uncharacterized protein n=1 Tax=Paenibacillus antibioticophila TaxID=1274374 RepID=A0A919XPW4_9BACL|nr:hypothetical protein [Paenibacillus antibioticophila]GIO35759.1 hypothetical protein J41TS12_06200 [Paenibacillus antibioticophila]